MIPENPELREYARKLEEIFPVFEERYSNCRFKKKHSSPNKEDHRCNDCHLRIYEGIEHPRELGTITILEALVRLREELEASGMLEYEIDRLRDRRMREGLN